MRTYAILICLMSLLFFSQGIKAQSITECEKLVQETVNAINNHSAESLQKHLSPDFECSGQKGNVATLVLNQIVVQLNEHVSKYEKISESKDENSLTLVYKFTYSRVGERTSTFVFNSENKIKRLDLFAVMVKKADKEIEFERPQSKMISIPFEITSDNLIVVTAMINGEKCKFIIDSGAPSLYLNSKYFKANGNKKEISLNNSKDVNGSSINGQDVIAVDSFNFNGIQAKNIKVMMSDLSHLENGLKIYGLIGYSIYKDYDLLFDYQNKTLTLIAPDYTDTFLKENKYKFSEVSLSFNEEKSFTHIPCVNAQIDKKNFLLAIDCGAGTNLLDSQLWTQLKKNIKDVKTTDLKGANNGNFTEVHTGKLRGMKIGNKKFKNTETVFSNIDHLNATRSEAIQGLIGYEILSRQKTILCYKNKKLIFID